MKRVAIYWLPMLIGTVLFSLNAFFDTPMPEGIEYIQEYAYWLLAIIILSLGIDFLAKRKYNMRTAILSYIFLSLQLIISYETVSGEIALLKQKNIEQMNTKEKAEIQFERDLQEGSLKWFVFGIMTNQEEIDRLQKEENLEVYFMGCIAGEAYTYYNILVMKHRAKKHK